jgi:hypothetical protein
MFWVVIPIHSPNLTITPWDIGPVLLLGGLWVAAWLWLVAQYDLLPKHHPVLDDPHPTREREQYETA